MYAFNAWLRAHTIPKAAVGAINCGILAHSSGVAIRKYAIYNGYGLPTGNGLPPAWFAIALSTALMYVCATGLDVQLVMMMMMMMVVVVVCARACVCVCVCVRVRVCACVCACVCHADMHTRFVSIG